MEKIEDYRLLEHGIKLPDYIHADKFAEAHFAELKDLLTTISNPRSNKLVHQLMPNRLRRRAMTQNPRRLPRRFREMHIAQMAKSGTPKKNKRPSRKYRRKPSNLLKEYARRMQKFTWLETHIWHAKRFHMKELWGYKIPFTPCDRQQRAAYRAVARHCLAQDVSFEGCIEVIGPEETLKEGLVRLSAKNCGLTINARGYLSGKREGKVTLFEADSFPLKALGQVRFMWKPKKAQNAEKEDRVLWIWVHPCYYKDVLKQLIFVFNLENVNKPEVEVSNGHEEPNLTKNRKERFEEKKKEDKLNFITKNKSHIRIPEYANGLIKVLSL